MSRVFLIGVTVLAMALGAVYLGTRGEAAGTSLAVYSAPAMPGASTAFMFVESFDLLNHGTVPVTIEEVGFATAGVETPVAFEQEGRDPVLVRFRKPPDGSRRLVVRARNRIAALEAEVTFEPAARQPSRMRELGWPLDIECKGYHFVLLSRSGVPSVGWDQDLLLLSTGRNAAGARVVLEAGEQESSAVIEPWGGAVLSFKPRSMKVRARLSLSLDDEARATQCVTEFLAGARPRGVRVVEQTLTRNSGGYHVETTLRTRTKADHLFAMAFTWRGGRPGAMVDARAAEVHDGTARAGLDLPGPGLYIVRFTTMPMATDTRGVNVLLAAPDDIANSEITDSEALLLTGRDAGPTPEALVKARPFVLATLAASVMPGPGLLVNTSGSVRAASRDAKRSRDLWLLGLLSACLGALITWMAVVTVRGHFLARRRLMEGGDEWGADARRINPSSGLLPVALLVFILAATAVALIFVLRTM